MRDLRRHYSDSDGLMESNLRDEPFEQLRVWFEDAVKRNEVEWLEINAATLATSSNSGDVTARVVLLKGIEEDGLLFFTNYDSPKGRQLAANPRAALVVYWPHVARQVRITGRVERVTREVSEEYFHSRPRGSQIGAAVSDQSTVISNRADLERRVADLSRKLGDNRVPLPDNWGGYRLIPEVFEFWQGRTDRLHDRFRFRKDGDTWIRERLAP